jgi:hypothetical protein
MLNKKALAASVSAPPAVYVEDVFSTFLYSGTGASLSINNGIDLAGEGGLVWIKSRTSVGQTWNHSLIDTDRGNSSRLYSNLSGAANSVSSPNGFTHNNNGFTVGTFDGTVNNSSNNYCSWTFRKQPKFFDVVTYTGNGAGGRDVSHSLGSVPGMIIIKRTNATSDWAVWHRGDGTTFRTDLSLNSTSASGDSGTTSPHTSTTFNLSRITTAGGSGMNDSGGTYVAYLFAHNAGGFGTAGTDNVISCGSYVGDGTNPGPVINLGFEPQWLLVKNATTGGNNWLMYDVMRGMPSSTTNTSETKFLRPNTSDAEAGGATVSPTATGFQLNTTFAGANESGSTFIYMAIRRPMKVPTTGTEVFYSEAIAQTSSPDSTGVPFPPDLVNSFSRNGTDRSSNFTLFQFVDRLRGLGIVSNAFDGNGGKGLLSSSTIAEYAGSYVQLKADSRNITKGGGWNDPAYGNWIHYFFRRATGFMDVVCWTGSGSTTTQAHNLGVAPELIIQKRRTGGTGDWNVSVFLSNFTDGVASGYLNGSNSFAQGSGNSFFTSSATNIGIITGSSVVNESGSTYVAYLFASVAGVSKVFSYTGNGSSQTINCAFTAGARLVLIKRTDSTGDWYVWDTARGIVSGNDPHLSLNTTAAEVTSNDSVDPDNSGFIVNQLAATNINVSSATYIGIAIA